MKVYFIGAGPGQPELLTLKAVEIIRRAGVIVYAGSLVNPTIVERYGDSARRVYDSAGMSLDELKDVYVWASSSGLDVARLHSGEPAIYGAIAEQMALLDELGIEYEVVPGISSFQLAAARLSCELTVPGLSQTVVLTRVGGKTPGPSLDDIAAYAKKEPTLVLFLSISMLADIVERLKEGYPPDTPVVVAYRVGWQDEKIVKGSLCDIVDRVATMGIKKTALIMVGKVFGDGRGQNSCLYDKGFSHGYRQGR